jgi:2-iminobutanoate/2-iminopropanoate deaminase
MVALDPATGQLIEGGVYAQARQILRLLGAGIPDWGLSLDHLVSVRIYTTRFDQFAEINRAWEEVVPAAAPPARTSLGVAALPLGAAVEMEFAFYKDS